MFCINIFFQKIATRIVEFRPVSLERQTHSLLLRLFRLNKKKPNDDERSELEIK